MFKCKGCEALRSENEHLRSMVDRLLLQYGIPPELIKEKTEDAAPAVDDDGGDESITYGIGD